ncbi:MAG: fibronectin type III domain-containing protein [Micromonosporaceae bacterium]
MRGLSLVRVPGGSHRRSGGFVSVGIVLTLVGAMAATLLGAGAFIDLFNVSDGATWLWSGKPGSSSRVNANSGRVDMRQPLVDARGHRVRVTQNDKYLIMHDLDTGRVTSVDLTRMGFTGTVDVGTTSEVSVVLHGDSAAIVDRTRGLVRGIDPVTLRASRNVLRLPPPIAGGAYDSDGRLWLAVPSEGTVVAARVDQTGARTERTEVVADPKADLALTALDHGALAVDRDGGALVMVSRDDVTRIPVSGSLDAAAVPPRTVGRTVAVTVPGDRSVLVLKVGGAATPSRFALPEQATPGTAVPYGGRIYVPDEKHSMVYVFNPSGSPLKPIVMTGAKGELELEVREGKLFINSPDTSVARVVDSDGRSKQVDKYRDDVSGGDGLKGRVLPAPNPGDTEGDRGNDEKQGPPGPPVPVTAVAGDEQVRLSWGAAARNGAPIQRYQITWDGGAEEVSGGAGGTVIDGLDNGTAYTFEVLARNKYGEGPPALSEPVTPTDHIPATPRDVRAAVAPDEGGAKVTWDPVEGARDYVVTALRNGSAAGDVPPTTVSGEEAVIRGLTYGQPYRFTVVARNDSGAGSDPSEPSNEVRPYAAPAAPQNPSAQGTGKSQVTVRWQPGSDNGDPVTKYVVTPSSGDPVTVDGSARQAVLDGLPTGQTVRFEIRAHNKAGAGQPATTSARVGQAPTITINRIDAEADRLTVRFSVDGHGMSTTCSARVEGGSSRGGSCSSITLGGLQAGKGYTVVVSASNEIGASQARRDASTSELSGAIRCKNGSSGEEAVYCDPGISVKSSPRVGASTTRKVHDGARLQAVCKMPDSDGDSHYAYIYNNEKRSKWWIRLPDGGYVMHVWLNLDRGDGDTANLAILPRC